MSSAQAHPTPPASTQPTASDWLFLLSCAVALAVVAWFGKMNYTEANKTETAKRNGEAVVSWMQEATAGRFEADFGVAACAGTAPPPDGAAPAADKAVPYTHPTLPTHRTGSISVGTVLINKRHIRINSVGTTRL